MEFLNSLYAAVQPTTSLCKEAKSYMDQGTGTVVKYNECLRNAEWIKRAGRRNWIITAGVGAAGISAYRKAWKLTAGALILSAGIAYMGTRKWT